MKVGQGSFFGEAAQVEKYAIACNPVPQPDCTKRGVSEFIKTKIAFKATDDTINKVVSDDAFPFPDEYSITGWFKWE